MSKAPFFLPQHVPDTACPDDLVRDFDTHGVIELPQFLDEETVNSLLHGFESHYAHSLNGQHSIVVGEERFMIPFRVEGPFNDPRLYASPGLMEAFRHLLGPDFVLNCATCVTAMPGAPAQHRHQDFPGLFQSPVDAFCGSYAINLFVPLVALNEQTGTTRIWPGTHRRPIEPDDAKIEDSVFPEIPPGSALLMDYRVLHEGTPNRSQHIRPILCLAYSRSWFIDTHHFQNQAPLQISDAELKRVPSACQRLFSRSQQPLGRKCA